MELIKNSTDFKKLPVEEILAIIAENDGTRNTMYQRAFSEFCLRYKKYIASVCKNTAAVKNIFNQREIEEIVSNTFTCVSKGAKTYKSLASTLDEGENHKRVKGWLSRIAKNEIYHSVQKESKAELVCESIEYYPDFSDTLIYKEDEEQLPGAEQILFEKAMALLPEKFRDVLETYLAYEDENGVIPPEFHNRLCRTWQVHPNYLRKIKKQAIDKLKTIIDNLLNQTKNGAKIKKRRGNAGIRKETEDIPAFNRPVIPRNTGTS